MPVDALALALSQGSPSDGVPLSYFDVHAGQLIVLELDFYTGVGRMKSLHTTC